jgi:hypothetical protein
MWVFLDLPGDLVRDMKQAAAQQGQRLSLVAEESLRRGLSPAPPAAEPHDHPLFPHPDDLPANEMTLGEAFFQAKIH